MRPNFRVDFFSEKIYRDFSIKIHPFAEKGKKIRGVSLVNLKNFFYWYFSWKIEGEFNFLVNFFFVTLKGISI